MNAFMEEAIKEARTGILNGHGGPFGCVIVKDGMIIGRGHNMVLVNKDSTCHGEIMAIHDAEKKIDSYDLSGCELYTTGEPCPMCLAAAMWANIDIIYYGCNLKDTADIGFRDEKFDIIMGGRELLKDYIIEMDREACLKLYEEYSKLNAQRY